MISTSAHTAVLLQTVGSIQEDIVSTRDVQIAYQVEKILSPEDNKVKEEDLARQDTKKKSDPAKSSSTINLKLDFGDKEFNSALSAYFIDQMAYREADSFKVAQIDSVVIQQATTNVSQQLQNRSEWKTLQVSDEELKKAVTQKLTAERFIKIKTDAMTTVVTDQEAMMYFEKNRLKFGQLPFANFKQNIKAFLSQQQLDDRLKTLFETLKKKYQVKNYITEGLIQK